MDVRNINVLDVVLKHLKNSILTSNEDIRPEGGIWIKPKPKDTWRRTIQIGLLGGGGVTVGKDVMGFVNINAEDVNERWVREILEIVGLVMDQALIDAYFFTIEEDISIYYISRGIIVGNIRCNFTIPKAKLKKQNKKI